MKELLYVFIGGGMGSLVRYGLSRFIILVAATTFPLATLLINVLASFILGLFLGYLDIKNVSNSPLKLLIAVGFCGGFSTFSTFSYETLVLLKNGQTTLAFGNILWSVVLCLAATFGGIVLAKSL